MSALNAFYSGLWCGQFTSHKEVTLTCMAPLPSDFVPHSSLKTARRLR
ncbi:MAG TPA: hypothetical protein VKS78_19565 [Roseiarcus sp.]|nr:hypothetical protein [Roseiarcus sp.]